MTNMETKLTLLACRTFEDFDTIMEQTWCKTDSDKIEYLHQLFNTEIDEFSHEDYIAIANSIMHRA